MTYKTFEDIVDGTPTTDRGSVSLPNTKNKASRSKGEFYSPTTKVRPKCKHTPITVVCGSGEICSKCEKVITPPQPKKIKPIPDNIVSLELLGEKVAEIIDYLNSMEENK